MKNIFAILFICVLMMPLFGQNDGIVPPTSTRTRIQLSEQARLSKTLYQFLITDANKKIKYWNKDTVFVNFFKINVDSLIKNYNDTVAKGGTPCRDSMYLIGNTLYHKSAYCAIQSAVIMSECTDSLWKIGADIWHRNTACQVQNFTVIEGCQGARTYFKASIGDTIGLSPSPVCGDLLVIDSDTCKDVLYVRGSLPVKWNYVGAYLKNENCFDFPVCKDSVWRSGKQIYHRNIDCNIQSFTDSNNVDYKFTSVGATGEEVLKDTLNRLIKFRKVQGAGSTKVTLVSDVITVRDTALGQLDTLRTLVADDTQLKFTHSPSRTSFVTINAGAGTKFTNWGLGAYNEDGRVTIEIDSAHQIFDGVGMQLATAGTTGANNGNISLTPQLGVSKVNIVGAGINTVSASTGINGTITVTGTEADGDSLNEIQVLNTLTSNSTTFKVELKKDASTNFQLTAGIGTYFDNFETGATGKTRINIDTTNSIFNGYNYDVINIGTGAEIYRTTTGTDPKTFNLRKISAGGGVTVTQNANDITIATDTSSSLLDPCLINQIPNDLYTVQSSLKKDEFGCLGNIDCGWSFSTASAGLPLMLSGSCIRKCIGDPINCVELWQNLNDDQKPLIAGGTDMMGIYRVFVDVINRQGKRISDLENPPNDNIVQIADRGTISTMQVARRVYEQQKTIDAQQNTINSLIERLEKLEKR